MSLDNSKADCNEVADEIYRLRELKKNAQVQNAERQGQRQRIEEMTEFLNEQTVRRLIEEITLFDDRFTFEFKSDAEIDVEI